MSRASSVRRSSAKLAGGAARRYVLLLVNQVLVGLFLGLLREHGLLREIESAGRVIDHPARLEHDRHHRPMTGRRHVADGPVLMMTALMVLLVCGLHMVILEGILNSFKVFPPTLGSSGSATRCARAPTIPSSRARSRRSPS